MTSDIVILLLFGTFNMVTCEQLQLKREHFDKALVGHSVLEINRTHHHDCARDCLSFAICKSFDYDRSERSCKLNDVDSSSVDPSEFITKKGSIFSDISEWSSAMVHGCRARTCKMDQKCFVNAGSHVCRDITCPVYQQLENGYIKVYALNENRFRDKAMVKCDDGYTPSEQEVECLASGHWQQHVTCVRMLGSDCKELLEKFPGLKSGVYEIELWESGKILTVVCDMETDGGGWTIFHRRIDGSVEFYRNYSEYENGFGNVDGELWLGLKYIQELAGQGRTDLRLDLTNENDVTVYETFHEFYLTDGTVYRLIIGEQYSFNNTASSLKENNRWKCSTFDRDLTDYKCPEVFHGAWWYSKCGSANLNGLYVTPGTKCNFLGATEGNCGHIYEGFNGHKALKRSSMMLRRIGLQKV